MSHLENDDVTLARFRYRVTTTNEGTARKEDFGERYTAPTERVTFLDTTSLAGVEMHVARAFGVRLLAVPTYIETYEGNEFQGLQWRIGLTLTPQRM